MLAFLLHRCGMRGLLLPDMAQLQLRMFQLTQLLAERLPRLQGYFEDVELKTVMFAADWFLTLFARRMPTYLVHRVLDIVLGTRAGLSNWGGLLPFGEDTRGDCLGEYTKGITKGTELLLTHGTSHLRCWQDKPQPCGPLCSSARLCCARKCWLSYSHVLLCAPRTLQRDQCFSSFDAASATLGAGPPPRGARGQLSACYSSAAP